MDKKSFYKEHKDRLAKKSICGLCGGSYTHINKAHHENTRKHKMEIMKKELENLKTENDKIKL